MRYYVFRGKFRTLGTSPWNLKTWNLLTWNVTKNTNIRLQYRNLGQRNIITKYSAIKLNKINNAHTKQIQTLGFFNLDDSDLS